MKAFINNIKVAHCFSFSEKFFLLNDGTTVIFMTESERQADSRNRGNRTAPLLLTTTRLTKMSGAVCWSNWDGKECNYE